MHLCVTLGLITQPISSLIATFVQVKKTRNIWILTFVSLLIASYIFVFACLSPCPPFKSTEWGGSLMVRLILVI